MKKPKGANSMAVIVAGLLAVGMQTGCEDPAGPPPATQPAQAPYDESYVAALAAVNSFCEAWLAGDADAGRALLSQRALRQYPEVRIRDAIAAPANPRHAAYEISAGRRLGAGRYAFEVRLFFRYVGGHADRLETPLERVVVQSDQAGKWLIDEFPFPDDNAELRLRPITPPAD